MMSPEPSPHSNFLLSMIFSENRIYFSGSCSEERSMLFDYVLGGLVTAGLLLYLTVALVRPERF
jgi:K+-transporting ATPase KdpF subunit